MTAPHPTLALSSTVLDAPDAKELAGFYRRLLGWEPVQEEPGWVKLLPPGGGSGLGFQTSKPYVPPVWPASPGDQLTMLHLDFEVADLESAVAHAVAEGATPAEFQPQRDVRVMFDPVGHPFCLFVNEEAPGEPPAISPEWVAEQTREMAEQGRVTVQDAVAPGPSDPAAPARQAEPDTLS
ncbi:VOC family protein [Streptomyces sp. S063]|uniref:VOC family protein n=1 Tax=Streptomyces sp. S063 TaxID=2005885 RepID=UPI0010084D4C|nr:VOC family protein [Streptomyces sp. S063]